MNTCSYRPVATLGRGTWLALVCLAALAWPGEGRTQPTQAQIGAMRQACRADYMKLCASIPPGGAASLRCLEQNSSNLSAACERAVAAVSPNAARAASPASAEPADDAPQPPTTPNSPLWPHTLEQDGVSVTIYQPQVLS